MGFNSGFKALIFNNVAVRTSDLAHSHTVHSYLVLHRERVPGFKIKILFLRIMRLAIAKVAVATHDSLFC